MKGNDRVFLNILVGLPNRNCYCLKMYRTCRYIKIISYVMRKKK